MTTPVVPATAPASLTSPVAPGERIHTLDILRGFALLGMILVHFHQYMELDATGAEGLIGWVTWVGVETKAWGTFAVLFGVGFAVLLRGFEARGAPITAFYIRRLSGLAVFGFIAEAFFGFHVLLEYAVWGVPLLFMRRWSDRWLLVMVFAAIMISPVWHFAEAVFEAESRTPHTSMVGATATGPSTSADPLQQAEAAVAVASAGRSYARLVGRRLGEMRIKYSRASTWVPGANLALFIAGLLACRRGVFDDPRRHRRLIGAAMVFGLVSWSASWLLYVLHPAFMASASGSALGTGFGLVHDQWLCFTYAGALTLLLAYRPAWQKRLSVLGSAGRMALTNYMLQVAALDYLSSGYGAGLRVRPLFSILCTVLLFGVLAVFSRWWLSRYRFGPAEWLWRCFTYLRIQPLRLPLRAAALETA